ncbi:hypothetical protein AAKU58_004329 [Oxalobacteraceae bacterium GrIS 1.18]
MKCPNQTCENHYTHGPGLIIKHGFFTPKGTRQKTQRYKCKNPSCATVFSARTEEDVAWQKKPEINAPLFKLLVSGVSLRRAATILSVDFNTVLLHFAHLATISTSYIQVDELETFVHAKACCLSVPVAVRVKTGEILGFAVAKMPAKGKLASIGVAKYSWVVDERPAKFQAMVASITPCLKAAATFKSDAKGAYKTWINAVVPHVKVEQAVSNKKLPPSAAKPFDGLFAINNTFARMRHDMNRLARKTWSTTKSIEGLENHIWLYVAWNNQYFIK